MYRTCLLYGLPTGSRTAKTMHPHFQEIRCGGLIHIKDIADDGIFCNNCHNEKRPFRVKVSNIPYYNTPSRRLQYICGKFCQNLPFVLENAADTHLAGMQRLCGTAGQFEHQSSLSVNSYRLCLVRFLSKGQYLHRFPQH